VQIGVDVQSLLLLYSPKPREASLHLHVRLAEGPFKGLVPLRRFMWALIPTLPLSVRHWLDHGVYANNQQMRLPGQSKLAALPGGALALMPCPPEGISSPRVQHWVRHAPSFDTALREALIVDPAATVTNDVQVSVPSTVLINPAGKPWYLDKREGSSVSSAQAAQLRTAVLTTSLLRPIAIWLATVEPRWTRLLQHLSATRDQRGAVTLRTVEQFCPLVGRVHVGQGKVFLAVYPRSGAVYTRCLASDCASERLTTMPKHLLSILYPPPAPVSLPAAVDGLWTPGVKVGGLQLRALTSLLSKDERLCAQQAAAHWLGRRPCADLPSGEWGLLQGLVSTVSELRTAAGGPPVSAVFVQRDPPTPVVLPLLPLTLDPLLGYRLGPPRHYSERESGVASFTHECGALVELAGECPSLLEEVHRLFCVAKLGATSPSLVVWLGTASQPLAPSVPPVSPIFNALVVVEPAPVPRREDNGQRVMLYHSKTKSTNWTISGPFEVGVSGQQLAFKGEVGSFVLRGEWLAKVELRSSATPRLCLTFQKGQRKRIMQSLGETVPEFWRKWVQLPRHTQVAIHHPGGNSDLYVSWRDALQSGIISEAQANPSISESAGGPLTTRAGLTAWLLQGGADVAVSPGLDLPCPVEPGSDSSDDEPPSQHHSAPPVLPCLLRPSSPSALLHASPASAAHVMHQRS
jgi:hypothetical protein